MQAIKELILLLQQSRLYPLQQSAAIGDGKNPVLLRLLEGVSAGRYGTDVDAAADLFPDVSPENRYPAYVGLKSALREKLTDSIDQYFTELEGISDAQNAQPECQQCWLSVRKLSRQNASELALPLANRLLHIAEKFDLTLLCLDIALYLCIQYCLRGQNSAECAGANRKYQYFRQVYDAECQAEKYYTDIITLAVAQRASRQSVLQQAIESTTALQPLMQQYNSSKLYLYGYLTELMQHSAAHDYAQALRCCDTAIRFFQDRPYRAGDALQVFHYQRLICSIHLSQFEAGRQSAQACLDLVAENFFNQLKIKELHLLLALHTKQYAEAHRVFSGLRSNPQFDFLPEAAQEEWALHRFYLTFLHGVGLVESLPDPVAGAAWPPFDESTLFSGETRLTTARVAVEFLFLLQQKRYDDLTGLAKKMKEYCQKSLNTERTRRSYLFLTMLAQCPAGQFQRASVIPLTSGLLEKLKTTPPDLANQVDEIEILPYEDLWNFVLDFLNGPK